MSSALTLFGSDHDLYRGVMYCWQDTTRTPNVGLRGTYIVIIVSSQYFLGLTWRNERCGAFSRLKSKIISRRVHTGGANILLAYVEAKERG